MQTIISDTKENLVKLIRLQFYIGDIVLKFNLQLESSYNELT